MRRALWLMLCGACATAPTRRVAPSACTALTNATVIAAPDATPLEHATVLWCGEVLRAVGPTAQVELPAQTRALDAQGATVVAGFWNAHLHLTEPAFEGAAHQPASALAAALEALATRWGFVHVVDLGSNPADGQAVQARVAAGDVRGPAIMRAAGPFIAPDAQPVYVPVPLPVLRTPAQARAVVDRALAEGADAIKLMTASVVAHPPSPVMALEVVQAVTASAHAQGRLVFAHPTNEAGVEVARAGGVDVLAHTAPEEGPWTDAQARALVEARVSLIPTLSLWRAELAARPALAERFEADAVAQVMAFEKAGGTLLFGTDTGYRPEHDPSAEYALLARAHLSWRQVLAMLTTAPAQRLTSSSTGRLEPGQAADLVVLEGDPTVDVTAFSRVKRSILAGRSVFGEPLPPPHCCRNPQTD